MLRNALTLKSWLDNQLDQDFASVHISSFELKYINYSSCHISLSYLFGSYMYIQGCSWRRSQVVKIRIELAKKKGFMKNDFLNATCSQRGAILHVFKMRNPGNGKMTWQTIFHLFTLSWWHRYSRNQELIWSFPLGRYAAISNDSKCITQISWISLYQHGFYPLHAYACIMLRIN